MDKKKSFWDNPFGGVFDFNGDGKEDLCEQWIAMKIFEECTKKTERKTKSKGKASENNIIDLDDLDIEGI